MNARAHIRKAIKWGGAVVCVVILVLWIGSAWWRVLYVRNGPPSGGIDLAAGKVMIFGWLSGPVPNAANAGWTVEQGSWFSLGFEWQSFARGGRMLAIPLWLPLLLTLIPTTIAWRRDARARRLAILGRCTKCGYDLAGLNADAPCPECGRVLAARRL